MIGDRHEGPVSIHPAAGGTAMTDKHGNAIAFFFYREDAEEIRDILNKPRDEITVSLT